MDAFFFAYSVQPWRLSFLCRTTLSRILISTIGNII